MEFIGTRNMDELGRIVIPNELRRALDLKTKDAVDMYVEDKSMILKKNTSLPHCIICNDTEHLIDFKQKNSYICPNCKKEISNLD